jgi:hypothetical protein
MSAIYFEAADRAAETLGLPLLLAASAQTAVPRAAAKLSDRAVETITGGRLYSRLHLPEVLGGQVLWVCGPFGSQEYLPWAVAVAEHAAGSGRPSFLLDASRERPLESLTAGKGLDLPQAVQERIEAIGMGPAAGWASDLAGVRIVLPVRAPTAGPAPPDPGRWSLIVSRAVPEAGGSVPPSLASGIDGIVLVAAIRDHTEDELSEIVKMLRSVGAPLLGLVALGPVPRPQMTPLERWNRVDPWALGDPKEKQGSATRPGSPGISATSETSTASETPGASRPSGAAEASGAVEAPGAAEAPGGSGTPVAGDLPAARPPDGTVAGAIEPESRPISLGNWGQPRRKSRTALIWILVLVVIAGVVGIGGVRGWWKRLMPAALRTERSQETAPESTQESGRIPTPVAMDSTGGIAPAGADTMGSIGAPPDSGMAATDFGSPDSVAATQGNAASWPDTFVVHVNSFNHRSFADREAERLRGLDLDVHVVEVELEKRGRWYRVVVGAFPDSGGASTEAALLRERHLVSFAQILGRGGRGNPGKSSPQ